MRKLLLAVAAASIIINIFLGSLLFKKSYQMEDGIITEMVLVSALEDLVYFFS